MKKLRLVLFDQEIEYIELFANYIRSSDYAQRFDVKLFSQEEHFQQYINNGEPTDILLVSNDQSIQEYPQIESILYLVEDMVDESDVGQLFKYQPLSQLLSNVLTYHYERNGKREKKKIQKADGETKIISVFSATGGTGKTTTAFHLAKQMKEEGLEVFYLNLELVNSIALLFDVEDKPSSSPLLYYLKTNADQLQSKLKDLIVVDRDTSVPFFYFHPSAEEMLDLSEQEINLLLDTLTQLETYHYIVIDLESALDPIELAALKKSDQVLWLLSNDMYSFHKTSYLLEELHGLLNDGAFSDRVQLVLNRYTGMIDPKLADSGIEIDGYLPYIPEWKQLITKEQLENPVFSEYVDKLIRSFSRVGV